MGINLGRKYLSPANAEASYVSTFAARASRVGVGAYGLDPPHFLYGLSRMSSALPWNGSRNTGIAAVLFPTRITSRDVTSTTELASMSVALFFCDIDASPSPQRVQVVLGLVLRDLPVRDEVPIQLEIQKQVHAVARRAVRHAHVRPARPKRAARLAQHARRARRSAFFRFRVVVAALRARRAFGLLLLLVVVVQLAHGVQRGLVQHAVERTVRERHARHVHDAVIHLERRRRRRRGGRRRVLRV
mmetsp:Transcript_529/g.2035  ORF Transcript_529/g.2035 Transcript_529/m.2035 type:complete len:245 (+) Transcript_529:90-824(+)